MEMGPAHPDTSYYIRYRGAVYADAGKFSRCISLWSYALDMQQQMLDPLNPMTQSMRFLMRSDCIRISSGSASKGRPTRPGSISLEFARYPHGDRLRRLR
ncbi:hypothetical protein LSTR_LSTR007891 [Laodelphax striatellus]|uniref:Uncharacterized protein n=1 Tax=Laodelphax striatellus TaxID=195883 RepID=A0A482WXS4_LAOST|nr:hypothetical protein LSTR_LSTR007891 [Laodelphax striatellus]